MCLMGDDKVWRLYVYDTQRNLWHLEDENEILGFARNRGELYFLNQEGGLWSTRQLADPPDPTEDEGDIEWMAEFADFTEEDPDKKGLTRLQARLELEKGAEIRVSVQYDSDGVWRSVRSIVGEEKKRSYVLPIVPRRCDHYRIRLEGRGVCRVYSMSREYYTGSELKSKHGRN